MSIRIITQITYYPSDNWLTTPTNTGDTFLEVINVIASRLRRHRFAGERQTLTVVVGVTSLRESSEPTAAEGHDKKKKAKKIIV